MRGPYAQPSALPQADFAYGTNSEVPASRPPAAGVADEVIE
jgi:hypothetical protein